MKRAQKQNQEVNRALHTLCGAFNSLWTPAI